MIAYLFPGQGSQSVNMFSLLSGMEDRVKAVFEAASDASGRDVSALCRTEDMAELTKTENTQLAVSAMSCAFWKILESEGVRPDIAAGHSLGQYAAVMCCGALSLYDGFRLIAERARLMGGVRRRGALCAVLGCAAEAVEAVCRQVSDDRGTVSVALYNAPNQLVIGGDTAYVERALPLLAEAGALKTQLLNVDNAFHTDVMKEMEAAFAECVDALPFHDPVCRLLLNCKGGYAEGVEDIRRDLKLQSCHPVLWSGCMQLLAGEAALHTAEVGVGSVLGPLLKKHDRKLSVFPVSDARGREKFLAALHGEPEF